MLLILTNPGCPSTRGPDYEWGVAVLTSHIKACWTRGLAGNHESAITSIVHTFVSWIYMYICLISQKISKIHLIKIYKDIKEWITNQMVRSKLIFAILIVCEFCLYVYNWPLLKASLKLSCLMSAFPSVDLAEDWQGINKTDLHETAVSWGLSALIAGAVLFGCFRSAECCVIWGLSVSPLIEPLERTGGDQQEWYPHVCRNQLAKTVQIRAEL